VAEKRKKDKKGRFQFSLRTLLVATALFAIACAWVSNHVIRARAQRRAVESVLSRLGSVYYAHNRGEDGDYYDNYGRPGGPEWLRRWIGDEYFQELHAVEFDYHWDCDFHETVVLLGSQRELRVLLLTYTELSDDDLAPLKGLQKLTILSLERTNVTDAGVGELTALTQLQTLRLNQTAITDRGVAHLVAFNELRHLGLAETRITDKSLQYLSAMPRLEGLAFSETAVTDAGLKHLAKLPKLQVLYLDGTDVTDAGLKHLSGLTKLEHLTLDGSMVTGSGFAHLHGLRNLRTLVVDFLQADSPGMKALERALPALEWSSTSVPNGTTVPRDPFSRP